MTNETNVEVTEVTNPMDDVVEMMDQNPGRGKKLIGLGIAGVAALTAGAVVLFRKHKKIKKNEEFLNEEFDECDDFYDEELDEDDDLVVESTEIVEKDDEDSKKN